MPGQGRPTAFKCTTSNSGFLLIFPYGKFTTNLALESHIFRVFPGLSCVSPSKPGHINKHESSCAMQRLEGNIAAVGAKNFTCETRRYICLLRPYAHNTTTTTIYCVGHEASQSCTVHYYVSNGKGREEPDVVGILLFSLDGLIHCSLFIV